MTALMLSAPHSAASIRPLVLPAAESTADQRGRYPQALLERALTKANYPVAVSAFAAPASQERLMRLLESRRVDVIWSMASVERAERLRMVPFPIDRGLLGWRVLLASESAAPLLAKVQNREALSRFRGAQGHDWPDLAILLANGLPTAGSVGYESLFQMLDYRRVDYVARAVNEARREQEDRPGMAMSVVPDVVLRYRTALVFFVHRDDTELAEAIEQGLLAMQTDGSFQDLFDATFREDLAPLQSLTVRIIDLQNPLLPEALAQGPERLWWTPEERR